MFPVYKTKRSRVSGPNLAAGDRARFAREDAVRSVRVRRAATTARLKTTPFRANARRVMLPKHDERSIHKNLVIP
jgi:hypothetical protein